MDIFLNEKTKDAIDNGIEAVEKLKDGLNSIAVAEVFRAGLSVGFTLGKEAKEQEPEKVG